MHEIKDSGIVPYTAKEMFDLVADVNRYKEFLPWCQDSRVVKREKEDVVAAEIKVGYGPVHTTFATRNTHRTNQAIEMDLVEGPFEFLEGSWHFEPLPQEGCRLSLELRFEFAHSHLEAPFSQVFASAMDALVQAFRGRAEHLYGKR